MVHWEDCHGVMGETGSCKLFQNRLDGRLSLEWSTLHTPLCVAAEVRPELGIAHRQALLLWWCPSSCLESEARLRAGHGFKDFSTSVVFSPGKPGVTAVTPPAF